MTTWCPCGSEQLFEKCCGRFMNGQELPPSAEMLMRSRYSAYTLANIDYIIRTMRGPALQGFHREEAKQWAQTAKWKRLVVIKTWQDSETTAYVHFIAHYHLNQQPHCIHEISEFHYDNGQWYYINGVTPKVGRNAACPCGSGKKAKRCCLNEQSMI